jgi:serine kinase of HPr protein (carbohydrate metabolism regulator)
MPALRNNVDNRVVRTVMNLCTRTVVVGLLALQVIAAPAAAQAPTITIEKLIEDGWEVAGYIAAWENRTLILFKHKEHKYLVQCSVLVDVTRAQRIVTVCYEIK